MTWWQVCLQTLFKNIAELLKVKTIITLMVFGALTYGFIKSMVPLEVYGPIAVMVATYYFQRKEKV